MREIIERFINQFDFEPEIVNEDKLKGVQKYLIVGMGGSHLAGDSLKMILDEDILIVKNDHLPQIQDLTERLIINISFSGNTEETIKVFTESLSKKFNVIVISQSGKLLKLAEDYSAPYIKLPDDNIPPRLGLGYIFKGLLRIIKSEFSLKKDYFKNLDVNQIQAEGEKIAQQIGDKNLVIYSEEEFYPLAYYWKISFNENAKKAAFANVFPEIFHNEIEMFESQKNLDDFYSIFLITKDLSNFKNIEKINLLRNYIPQNKIIEFDDEDKIILAVRNILLASFASYFNAKLNNIDPLKINLIREIKNI